MTYQASEVARSFYIYIYIYVYIYIYICKVMLYALDIGREEGSLG